MTSILLLIIAALAWYIFSSKKKPPPPQTVTLNVEISSVGSHAPSEPMDKDAWDPVPDEYYDPSSPRREMKGVELRIRFQDLEGKITERDIATNWYAHNPTTGNGIVHAFCKMRQANRPFALNRIQHAVALETGEVISNLGVYLDSLYSKTPQAAVEQFLSDHSAAIFVLFSFAKADGAMRAKERAVISNWATSLGLANQEHMEELTKQIKGWYSTDHAFWDAVKTLQKQERPVQYLEDLWQAVTSIVQSDKTTTELEIKYLKYAADRLGQPLPEIVQPKKDKG
jgi:uncharacterized tellurite resistance protein B-like protein